MLELFFAKIDPIRRDLCCGIWSGDARPLHLLLLWMDEKESYL